MGVNTETMPGLVPGARFTCAGEPIVRGIHYEAVSAARAPELYYDNSCNMSPRGPGPSVNRVAGPGPGAPSTWVPARSNRVPCHICTIATEQSHELLRRGRAWEMAPASTRRNCRRFTAMEEVKKTSDGSRRRIQRDPPRRLEFSLRSATHDV